MVHPAIHCTYQDIQQLWSKKRGLDDHDPRSVHQRDWQPWEDLRRISSHKTRLSRRVHAASSMMLQCPCIKQGLTLYMGTIWQLTLVAFWELMSQEDFIVSDIVTAYVNFQKKTQFANHMLISYFLTGWLLHIVDFYHGLGEINCWTGKPQDDTLFYVWEAKKTIVHYCSFRQSFIMGSWLDHDLFFLAFFEIFFTLKFFLAHWQFFVDTCCLFYGEEFYRGHILLFGFFCFLFLPIFFHFPLASPEWTTILFYCPAY